MNTSMKKYDTDFDGNPICDICDCRIKDEDDAKYHRQRHSRYERKRLHDIYLCYVKPDKNSG